MFRAFSTISFNKGISVYYLYRWEADERKFYHFYCSKRSVDVKNGLRFPSPVRCSTSSQTSMVDGILYVLNVSNIYAQKNSRRQGINATPSQLNCMAHQLVVNSRIQAHPSWERLMRCFVQKWNGRELEMFLQKKSIIWHSAVDIAPRLELGTQNTVASKRMCRTVLHTPGR